MDIAFLGTGIMGAPMARHLAEDGHAVTVWNRTRQKAEPLAQHGARVAETPADAVRGAEVIVTMLTNGDVVRAVMEQAGDALPRGATWWQASTVGLAATEELMALAERHGLVYVDAPVVGTRGPAEERQLVVLASGPSEVVERCEPLFASVATKIVRLGEAGEGTRLKLVINHWLLAVTDAIAETIAYAQCLDLDPNLFLQTIKGGSLDVGYAHIKGPGMIHGELPVAFPLKHALKDAELILEGAGRCGIDLGLAPVVRDRYRRAAEAGLADADMGMVIAAMRPSRP